MARGRHATTDQKADMTSTAQLPHAEAVAAPRAIRLLAAPPMPVAERSLDVAFAHDYLTQRGGAERVVLAMARAFPLAPIHTSVYEPDLTYEAFADCKVLTTALNRVGLLRRNHRLGLGLYAPAFSRLEIDADLVICSSSGWAHGVRTDAPKLVYCHTPARWLWATDDYKQGLSRVTDAVLGLLDRPLRSWDRRAALGADRYIVNATVIRDRVRHAYGIDAEVLHPPPGLDPLGNHTPLQGIEPGFALVVSRLLPYKRVDLAISAMRRATDRLVIIGSGPDEARLRAMAGPNVSFLSGLDDAQLRWAYANASALVAMSKEDFGLGPLEAASMGTPTVAIGAGGYLDTVIHGDTGVLIPEPTAASVHGGLNDLEALNVSAVRLQAHAVLFSEERFTRRLREIAYETARAA
jgi:glycosyltransferase involved in cell wall biosynthesis